MLQGRINDKGIDDPTFVLKAANFYQYRSKFVSKSWLFLNFSVNLTSWLFDKMSALPNYKFIFILVSGSLVVVFPQFCSNII